MRRPIDQRSLSLLMKRPGAMSRFLTTGALPSVAKPSSPLITLLESLSPRDRSRIVGLKVGPALGYNGSRQFHTAHQALSWLIPANLSTMPASPILAGSTFHDEADHRRSPGLRKCACRHRSHLVAETPWPAVRRTHPSIPGQLSPTTGT